MAAPERTCPCCGRRKSELGGGAFFGEEGRCRPCHFDYQASPDDQPWHVLDCGHVGMREAYDYRRAAEALEQ